MRCHYPHLSLLTAATVIISSGCQDMVDPVTPDVDAAQFGHIAGSSGDSKIAFASDRDGDYEIYVMDSDGSNLTQITHNDDYFDAPGAWSPDGSRIVFESNRDGDPEIFVMDASGSNVTQLTHNSFDDRFPDWSSEDQIVFTSTRDNVSWSIQIYTMDADGSNQVRVSGKEYAVEYNIPNWSPDGSRIVFDRGRSTRREIWTMDADGGNPTRLTFNSLTDIVATWSPDGATIAFDRFSNGADNIWDMNANNGSGQRQLTSGGSGVFNQFPSYSPDSHAIAFRTNRDGPWEVYVMASDGSGQTNLTNHPSNDFNPKWSPVLAPPNQPPTADGGPNASYECFVGGASVTLDGSGSFDPDGDNLTYTWTKSMTVLGTTTDPTSTLTVNLSHGTHTITLTVDDGNGESHSDDVVITVEDTTDPTLTFSLDVTEIWPPDHRMVTVATGISATDACDAAPSVVISVTSNEDIHGTGDGDTAPDWTVVDNGGGVFDVQVRAERSGSGDGRTYTITVTARDTSGNEVQAVGEVVVPRDKGKGNKKGR